MNIYKTHISDLAFFLPYGKPGFLKKKGVVMPSGVGFTLESAFQAGQKRLNILTQNEVNRQDPHFSRLETHMMTQSVGTYESSVQISDIHRCANPVILKGLSETKTTLESWRQLASFYGVLESMSGSVGAEADLLSGSIADFFQALEATNLTMEQDAYLNTVVEKASALAEAFSSFSQKIQDLRSEADHQVARDVEEVQKLLSHYHDVNQIIARSEEGTTELFSAQDKQSGLLKQLSSYFSVSQTHDRFPVDHVLGPCYLWGPGGVPLVTKMRPSTLSFEEAGTMSPDNTCDKGDLSTLVVQFDKLAIDITAHTTSGEIGALLKLRDQILPDMQAVLDRGAATLADTMNAIHTQGSAYAAPAQMISSRVLDSAQPAVTENGQLRIATLDAEGMVVSLKDIPLEPTHTLNDVVTFINDEEGFWASWQDGHIKVGVSDATHKAQGVALVGLDASTETLMTVMGLNDLFWSQESHQPNTSDVSPGFALDLRMNPSIQENPRLFAHTKLSQAFPLGIGIPGVQKADGITLSQLAQEKHAVWTFEAAGDWQNKKLTPTDWGRLFTTTLAQKTGHAKSSLSLTESTMSKLESLRQEEEGVDVKNNHLEVVNMTDYMQNVLALMRMTRDLKQQIIASMA
ncbi:FlgK family flagellar hook-associated protein [Candidatus Hepatobacter penaei]|uniref:FlgK family flagellar hook-associated protein n=1 Tax=Candidatus Hepatobacter penaei TaxID=1274402 RepID=UPI0012E0970C|nr:hypothetical protein [Candidatus Hepatobacter penaei]